jgi:hypothetical protein
VIVIQPWSRLIFGRFWDKLDAVGRTDAVSQQRGVLSLTCGFEFFAAATAATTAAKRKMNMGICPRVLRAARSP